MSKIEEVFFVPSCYASQGATLAERDEQSRNGQIFVFTHEAQDPWERLGGTAFPPSPND
jgi:hypothetical protein